MDEGLRPWKGRTGGGVENLQIQIHQKLRWPKRRWLISKTVVRYCIVFYSCTRPSTQISELLAIWVSCAQILCADNTGRSESETYRHRHYCKFEKYWRNVFTIVMTELFANYWAQEITIGHLSKKEVNKPRSSQKAEIVWCLIRKDTRYSKWDCI